MQHKRTSIILIIAGALVVIVSAMALVMTQPVQAQCGSQASSCKNCHEVQAQMPVNNDGTAWHASHAFGDFCYICHAGNQQAMDKSTAHIGMVAPLSDIQASCAQCHPNDLHDRAQVYAAELGIQLGAASTPTVAQISSTATATPVAPAGSQSPATVKAAALAPEDPNLVNYVQRYKENALGQYPTNWGNVILLIMIGSCWLGGGALVVSHEGWLRFTLGPISPVERRISG